MLFFQNRNDRLAAPIVAARVLITALKTEAETINYLMLPLWSADVHHVNLHLLQINHFCQT